MGFGSKWFGLGLIVLLVQGVGAELEVSGRMGRHPDRQGVSRPLLHLVITVPDGATTPVPHLSTIMVLDRSGSMRESLTGEVKRGLADWVRRQPATDRFGLVLNAGTAYTKVQPQHLERPERAAATILSTDIRGQTILYPGLLEARRKALEEPSGAGWIRRVVILSDGRVTGGVTQPSLYRLQAHEMLQSGIHVSGIALGDAPRLEQLTAATEGAGGRLDMAITAQELIGVLDADGQAARSCAVAGVTVRIQGQPGWRPITCRGMHAQLNKRRRTARVNAGLLAPGARRDLFVYFRATEESPATAQAEIEVAWLDPREGTRHTRTIRVVEAAGGEKEAGKEEAAFEPQRTDAWSQLELADVLEQIAGRIEEGGDWRVLAEEALRLVEGADGTESKLRARLEAIRAAATAGPWDAANCRVMGYRLRMQQ